MSEKIEKIRCKYGMDKCISCANNLGNVCVLDLVDSIINYYQPRFEKEHYVFIEFLLDNINLSILSNEQIIMLNQLKEMFYHYSEGLENG